MNVLLLSASLVFGSAIAYIGTASIERGYIIHQNDGVELACGLDFIPPVPVDDIVYMQCVPFVDTVAYQGRNSTGEIWRVE